jgi:hypothetical protein
MPATAGAAAMPADDAPFFFLSYAHRAYIVALRGWQLQDRELEVQPV